MGEKLRHTPGEWRAFPPSCPAPDQRFDRLVTGPEGDGSDDHVCESFQLRGRRKQDRETALGNAALICLAPTAPHACDVPNCPGNALRERLEKLEALKAKTERLVTAVIMNRDTHLREVQNALHDARDVLAALEPPHAE